MGRIMYSMISLLVFLVVLASPTHSGPVNIHDVEKRLKRDLMVGYDKFITPQMDGDKPVNVSAGLSVASMDMDDQGILNCVIWFCRSWQDDRLAWDPQDYCGKKEMRIPAKMLWIPDLEFYNALDYGGGYFSNSFLRRRPALEWFFICHQLNSGSDAMNMPMRTGPGEIIIATSSLVHGPTQANSLI